MAQSKAAMNPVYFTKYQEFTCFFNYLYFTPEKAT